jgi:hypothetical protein
MDWHVILQVLRDVLTIVGVGKLVYGRYRQIKKAFSNQYISQTFQWVSRSYKKAWSVRHSERSVSFGELLQKKSFGNGIPAANYGIPLFKKCLAA